MSSKLVEELKKEHAAMVDTFDEVWKLGISNKKSRDMLLSAKELFILHLKKEEEKIYPVIRKAAESSPHLQVVLDTLARDIEEISKSAIVFFDKYSAAGHDAEFEADFSTLYSRITIRIQQEEDILYKEYERLY